MFKIRASILLITGSLLMLPGLVAAGPLKGKSAEVTATAASKGGAVTADGLMQRYEALAGSPENVKSLVNGLRQKAEVVLVGESLTPASAPSPAPACTGRFCPPPPTTPPPGPVTITLKFMPVTDPMGFGNIDVALALTEADLKRKLEGDPKPEHLQAALMGGSAGGLSFEGILQMRAKGAGWGEIAKSLDFELK